MDLMTDNVNADISILLDDINSNFSYIASSLSL